MNEASKIIWMCWFQGVNDNSVPELNKKCIQRWRELNPDCKVNVLSNDTIKKYAPEFFDITKNSPDRSLAARSDLLRILLLSKYGGTWADASVYPMKPLSDFYHDIINETGFFSYRFNPRSKNRIKGDRETVSWFLCVDKSNHYIIEKWKTKFISEFKNNKRWKYFTFHQALADLYDEDKQIKFIIDNMIQISQKIPHSRCRNKSKHPKVLESYVYKRPDLRRKCGLFFK